ncbi:MAG: hypothetical protein ABI619_11830 [Betaproteobacteria bacterium]
MNTKISFAFALASCLIVCSQANAALVQTLPWNNDLPQDTIRLQSAGNALRGTNGGAFKATRSDGGTPTDPNSPSSTWIETFCLELSEAISLGTTYNATVNFGREIIEGPTANKDPLSNFGAWLYASWVGYTPNASTNRAALASAVSGDDLRVATSMQAIIWNEVGYYETGTNSIVGNGGVSAAEWDNAFGTSYGDTVSAPDTGTKAGDWAAWQTLYLADTTWSTVTEYAADKWGDVVVLNLTATSGGVFKQDQIAISPGAGAGGVGEEIPEPMSLAIWGAMGAMGLVLRGRRRSVAA